MATQTTGLHAPNIHLYYEKKLLSTLEPRLVLQPLGMAQKIPKGMGGFNSTSKMKWLRYASINSSTTDALLSEGTPNTEAAFATSNVEAQLAQYGRFIRLSDVLVDTAIDRVVSNVSERLGKDAAKVVELLCVAELDAEAAIQHVEDRADDTAHIAGDVMSHQELIEAQIQQKADFISPHESGDYVAVLHPFCEFDLKADAASGSWVDISKYTDSNQKKLLNGEFGRMYGMRMLVSDKMTSIAAGADDPNESGTNLAAVALYNSYVIGEEAFGVVKLDGSSIKMLIKQRGSSGTADPMDQVSSVAYKINGFACKYLDSGTKRVIRIKSASALS